MYENVYKAALETGISRVIMASSVHADTFYLPRGERILKPYDIPYPDSPYGADKIAMEKLGREYARKRLEVICIRFGGVATVLDAANPKTQESLEQIAERAARLSHQDAVSLVRKCLTAEKVPNNFVILYGVSDNYGRIHDLMNPFGWQPVHNAENIS
ncbi:MAG: NAD-dependent epimerase/dehydratase family protein, partial [Candidatus Levyibacteriota bacterium]